VHMFDVVPTHSAWGSFCLVEKNAPSGKIGQGGQHQEDLLKRELCGAVAVDQSFH